MLESLEREGEGTMSDEAIKQHSKENSTEKETTHADTQASNSLREDFLNTRNSSDGGKSGFWTTYGPDGQPTSDCGGPLPRGGGEGGQGSGGKGGHGLPGLEIGDFRTIDQQRYINFPPIDQLPTAGKGNEKFPPAPSVDSIAPIMLPEFFNQYPKSPELDKVGESADKLAKLMKDNASPEEQKKAWDDFEKNSKDVPPNLAALRLQKSFYDQGLHDVAAEANGYNGKLSVVDYGHYDTLNKFDYKEPNIKFFDPTLTDKPEVKQAAAEFAERLQKGVSSEELNKLVPELLDKLTKQGLDSMSASVAIDYALDHAANNKYSNLGDSGPVFMVDGKPMHIWTAATILGANVQFNCSPEAKKLFG